MIEKSALGEAVGGEVADAVTDWLYIKDAVNSLILAREVDQPKERIYNIGGSSHSVREVADICRPLLRTPISGWMRRRRSPGLRPMIVQRLKGN